MVEQPRGQAASVLHINTADVRMARELGVGPRSLIKNIPAPTQQWKAPVEDWGARPLREAQRKAARKSAGGSGGGLPVTEGMR